MNTNDNNKYQEELREGLQLAEYNWLKDKAKHNMMISQANKDGEPYEISARELFQKMYNEEPPTFE